MGTYLEKMNTGSTIGIKAVSTAMIGVPIGPILYYDNGECTYVKLSLSRDDFEKVPYVHKQDRHENFFKAMDKKGIKVW